MIVAGCDVGSLTTKAVLMKNGNILGFEIIRGRADAVQSAQEVMHKLLTRYRITLNDIEYCIATGYGRNIIPFADAECSEISCHGRGANWLLPEVRTIIDVGGQDIKSIRIDERGVLEDFRLNSKCAAGTGRALELMAESLGVSVSELGPLSSKASEPVALHNPCSAITEIEIRHLVIEGYSDADIAAGIINITAHRIMSVAKPLGFKTEVVISGGVAKNSGIVEALEKNLGVTLAKLSVDPQFIGALGAAVIANEKVG